MKLIAFFFLIALFVVLTPGNFLTLPKKNMSKWAISLTHGVVFAIVWFIIHKPLTQNYGFIFEGAAGSMTPEVTEEKKKVPTVLGAH
jgi:hypothetical protein